MTHGSLFSGIGGFDLAAEWMGWENIFHCEIEEFPRKVLNYYWPKAISYEDIKQTDFTKHKGTINIISGGFPCQPFSATGKRKGTKDDRHLWPEMLRAIKEIQPGWVVGENVRGLINWNGGLVFDQVQADLEAEGYEVTPFLLPACAVNAPHRRDRVWFIAHSRLLRQEKPKEQAVGSKQLFKGGDVAYTINHNRRPTQSKGEEKGEWLQRKYSGLGLQRTSPNAERSGGQREHKQGQGEGQFGGCNSKDVTNPGRKGLQRAKRQGSAGPERQPRRFVTKHNWGNFPTQSPVCSRNDGISSKLDAITFPKWRNESIKAAGNAVVPQVVYQIFKAIEKYEFKCDTF